MASRADLPFTLSNPPLGSMSLANRLAPYRESVDVQLWNASSPSVKINCRETSGSWERVERERKRGGGGKDYIYASSEWSRFNMCSTLRSWAENGPGDEATITQYTTIEQYALIARIQFPQEYLCFNITKVHLLSLVGWLLMLKLRVCPSLCYLLYLSIFEFLIKSECKVEEQSNGEGRVCCP